MKTSENLWKQWNRETDLLDTADVPGLSGADKLMTPPGTQKVSVKPKITKKHQPLRQVEPYELINPWSQ